MINQAIPSNGAKNEDHTKKKKNGEAL
jgi:hypothetical protein